MKHLFVSPQYTRTFLLTTIVVVGVGFSFSTHAACFCGGDSPADQSLFPVNSFEVEGEAGRGTAGGITAETLSDEVSSDRSDVPKQFEYSEPLFYAYPLRVRPGNETILTWNTGGRASCEITAPRGYRYPDAAPLNGVWNFFGLGRFLSSAEFLPPEGVIRVSIVRPTRFTFTCTDPGRDGARLGALEREVVVRLLPVYPEI